MRRIDIIALLVAILCLLSLLGPVDVVGQSPMSQCSLGMPITCNTVFSCNGCSVTGSGGPCGTCVQGTRACPIIPPNFCNCEYADGTLGVCGCQVIYGASNGC